MSNLQLDCLPYTPIRGDLIFYYPKVMKAIGTERQLFPNQQINAIRDAKLNKDQYTKTERDWTTEHGDIRGYLDNEKLGLPNVGPAIIQWESRNNPNLQTQIEKVVDDLLNPKRRKERSILEAQYLLMGFCDWLDRAKYTYHTDQTPTRFYDEGKLSAQKAKKLGHAIKVGEQSHEQRGIDWAVASYNIFAIVKSPIGNCQNAASAFALLLFLNGFRKESLALCQIKPQREGDAIVFQGEKHAKLSFIVPTQRGVVTPVFELANTRGGTISGRQCTPQDVDQPFENHWIVKCNGHYFDPLYRCSYESPSHAFDVIERLKDKTTTGGLKSPAPLVCEWKFINLYRDYGGGGRYFFEFTSKKICEALKMKRAEEKKFLLDKPKAGEGSALFVDELMPLGLGRVFGWCVPADEQAMRNVLMVAVLEYEKGLGIFRRPSEGSIDFCKKSRAFCGKLDKVPKAIYDPAKETSWNNYKVWTEKSAREIIYNAMYLPKSVGETLRKCLWKAFDVPSYFRA